MLFTPPATIGSNPCVDLHSWRRRCCAMRIRPSWSKRLLNSLVRRWHRGGAPTDRDVVERHEELQPLPVPPDDETSHHSCHRGQDCRWQHGLAAAHQRCNQCPPRPRAWYTAMVNHSSTAKRETNRMMNHTPVTPLAYPCSEDVRALRSSKECNGHFITWSKIGEDCPRGSTLDHAGCRAARAHAVQPLQAPRAWSWRFIRHQRRRRQVRWWRLRPAGRFADVGRL